MTSAFTDFALPDADSPVVNGYIAKPITASSLLNSIMDVFDEKAIIKAIPEFDTITQHTEYKKLLGGLTILVVEDNRVNQEIAVEILKTIDITARIACDGEEAVKAVAKETFDAVLMDIQMPNMDGYEATRRIRRIKDFQSLPIIAMTASVALQDENRCIEAGMNGFVPKPIRQEKLFSTLLKFIRPELESEFSETVLRQDGLFTIEHQVSSAYAETDNNLPELNIHEAARNLNLDMDVYKKILSRFFNNNIHTMERLRTAVNQNQWKHLQSLAHGLKGSSGNIGADQVKEIIEKIELFCRNIESDPSDKTQINLLLSDFEKHFARLLASIKSIISIKTAVPADEMPSEEDIALALPVLSDLINALKASDPIAINQSIASLKQFKTGFSMQSIENKINEYDYDDAIAALTQLTSQWSYHSGDKTK